MKIKNINGTSDNTCKCPSWLAHWEKFSTQKIPAYCSVENCSNKPEVGAHVQRGDVVDFNWYIIPLCKEHNGKKNETLTIDSSIKLASGNVSSTCGKN
ncbi:hypothetical protein [Leptospira sanjuanensis]|uniref:hypothetical protein n=1 Tax=Leptospira sanjuanensis TaxID=2879643 RepID=UPI001EE78CF7|nr:hypothetical protein [Leptospira sanjuanensis]MCG6169732.1 hypothetical protein [Leptospira sanjuanensis]